MLTNGADKLVVRSSEDLKLVRGSFTIEAWVRPVPGGYYQTIVEKRMIPVSGDYWFGIDKTGYWRFTIGKYNGDILSSSKPESGRLYHVAAVYDGSSANAFIYVNGALSGSGVALNPQTLSSTDAPLYIGASKAEGSANEDLVGAIDEVRLWNVALTSEQINARMKTKLSGTVSGLVAYWHFDNATSTTVPDVTGNGHTADIVGQPLLIESPFGIQ